MKTQIIQLEPHDDTLSVRDKMDWSQTPRVLLIWPEKGKVLRARLDLILLERFCSSHGSQLAISTTDKEVIFQAEQAGIPVFRSRSDAQLQPWGKSFREFRRQELEKYVSESLPIGPIERDQHQPRKRLPIWVRIPVFILGILSVLSLAAYILPSADIIVTPESRQQTLTVPVIAEPGRSQITLSGLLPARELMILVDGQLSIPVTGSVSVPTGYAQGEVLFTNLGDEGISIPPDAILSTTGDPPILFRTLAGGTTPPIQGGQLSLAIEAFLPGESGNIPANQITKINFESGAEMMVTNPLPTEGGTDIKVPAPTPIDKMKLTREMTQFLEDRALEQIQGELGPEDFLLSNRLESSVLVEEEFSPQEGSPGDVLWLDKSIEYLVYFISGDDLHKLAIDLVEAQYQDQSYIPDLDSIQLQPISSPEKQGEDNYTWEFQLVWVDSQSVNKENINDWISAKSLDEAERVLLEKLDLKENPQIRIVPKWWPWVPALPFRIHVIQGGI